MIPTQPSQHFMFLDYKSSLLLHDLLPSKLVITHLRCRTSLACFPHVHDLVGERLPSRLSFTKSHMQQLFDNVHNETSSSYERISLPSPSSALTHVLSFTSRVFLEKTNSNDTKKSNDLLHSYLTRSYRDGQTSEPPMTIMLARWHLNT